MPPTRPVLPLQQRADLFAQLHAMEKAGLPFDRALALLHSIAPQRVRETRRFYEQGTGLADACAKSGLFTPPEASIVRSALCAGSPAQTYGRLAERYTQRAKQVAQLKSRLWLPGGMLVAALFIQPLPKLVSGTLNIASYLFGNLLILGAIALAFWLISKIPGWLETTQNKTSRQRIDAILTSLPLIGDLHTRRCSITFFEYLALLVEAGTPILDALPTAVSTVASPQLQTQFSRIKPAIEKGTTLANALVPLHFPARNQALQYTQTGEASGTLPEMLFRHVNQENDAIELKISVIMQWIPKLIYAAISVWIALGILQGGIMPAQIEIPE